MSAAGFILAINIVVASLFATAFTLVAIYSRRHTGARWLAMAYGLGVVNAALEFVLPGQADTRMVELLIYVAGVGAFMLVVVGLASHYQVRAPWGLLWVFGLLTLTLNPIVLGLPYDTLLRNVLYQAPYALIHIIAAGVVLRVRRRTALEYTLLAFLCVSGVQFVGKPLLAEWFGGPESRTYFVSLYAAISQAMTAVLIVANGLLMLTIMVRDAMAEMAMRSETDKLSGLFNRRGFEEHAERLLATAGRMGGDVFIVVSDLDHFKRVNDTYGHGAGDRVIEAFAGVLRTNYPEEAVLGRIGGEEFAILCGSRGLSEIRIRTEQGRLDIAALTIAGLPVHRRVTASFGIAQFQAGESLSDLLRRADMALYEAKKSGRNTIRVAPGLITPAETTSAADAMLGADYGSRRQA